MSLPPLPPLPALKPRPDEPLADAMYALADALRYPKDARGRVYDVTFLAPILAYHLARAGAVIDPGRAVIKARTLPAGPGVAEGAVDWVGVDEPDQVVDVFADVTIGDVDHLPPEARAELLRRLAGDQSPDPAGGDDLDQRAPWHVQTSIKFDEGA